MTVTIDDLFAERTEDQVFDDLIDAAEGEDLPTTSWQSGSVARTLLRADARSLSDHREAIRLVAKGGWLDSSEGGWLTLLARNVFLIERRPAAFATGRVIVGVASGAGPANIGVAGLVVTDGTRRFRSTNTAAVTIGDGLFDVFEVKAEESGTAYNVDGETLSTIVTPASAGLSVTADTGSGWRDVDGDVEESDASLRARCKARWATLAVGQGPDAAYLYWATNTDEAPSVTRAVVIPGPGDGTVSVVIARAQGLATNGDVAAVQSRIDLANPLTDDPTVSAATSVPVAITGTVTFRSAAYNTTENRALATDALAALQASLGIGDDLDLGAVYAAIYEAAGIRNVDILLNGAATDVSVGNSSLAILTYSALTFAP